jgi:1-acyl-sn-glycerol-3-phosphate acyltransferase
VRTSFDRAILREATATGSGLAVDDESDGTMGKASSGASGAALRSRRTTPTTLRLLRGTRALMHIAGGLGTTMFVFPWVSQQRRQEIIRRWCRQLLAMLAVEARVHRRDDAAMPDQMLIVANHISWLDIFVLLSFQPARFVAKSDLKRMPVVGRLITAVGTLYIERERRRDTHTVNRATVEALERGDIVAVFPEATTSDGTGLLKFHSSLLQSAVDARGHVQPIAIRYRTPADEFCIAPAYVGDLNLVQSFWRVTGEPRIVAELHVTRAFSAENAHRRELSRAAEEAIRTALASPARGPAPGTRDDRRA